MERPCFRQPARACRRPRSPYIGGCRLLSCVQRETPPMPQAVPQSIVCDDVGIDLRGRRWRAAGEGTPPAFATRAAFLRRNVLRWLLPAAAIVLTAIAGWWLLPRWWGRAAPVAQRIAHTLVVLPLRA